MRYQQAWILVCLAVAACSSSSSTPAGPTISSKRFDHRAPAVVVDPPLPETYTKQRPIIEGAAILSYLPDDAIAAVVVRSPEALEAALNANAIFKEYRKPYEDFSKQLTTIAGVNLLEPMNLKSIGVDPDGPAGAAFLLRKREVVILFATLKEPSAFQTSIESIVPALAIGQFYVQRGNNVTILRVQQAPEVAGAIIGNTAMLIISDRTEDLESVIAWLRDRGPEASLAQTGRVKESFQGLDFGEDAAGFISVDNIVAGFTRHTDHEGDSYFLAKANRIENDIEAAKSEGAEQSRIDSLEAELEKTLEWQQEQQLRNSAKSRFMNQIFVPIGTLALGLDLDGPQSRVRVQIRATPGSLVARLLRRPKRPIVLPRRLGALPLILLAGHANPEAAKELLGLILEADGVTLEDAIDITKKEVGLDLSAGLALLEGELGGAVTLNREAFIANNSKRPTDNSMGLHVLARVRDTRKAQDYLNAAGKLPEFSKYARQEAKGTILIVPSPWGDRSFRVEVIDGFFEAKTVGDGSSVEWLPGEAERLNDEHNSAIYTLDPVLFSWVTMSSITRYMRDYSRGGSLSGEDAVKHKELRDKESSIRERLRLLETRSVLAQSHLVGRITMSARIDGENLEIIGGLFGTAANLGRSIQSFIESVEPSLQLPRLDSKSELLTLRERLDELREERWTLERGQASVAPPLLPVPGKTGVISPQSQIMIVVGGRSGMQIQETIKRRLPEMLRCYSQTLVIRPSLTGSITLKFDVSSKGRVKKAKLINSTLHAPKVEKCLLRVLRKTRFPQHQSSRVSSVTYPLLLSN